MFDRALRHLRRYQEILTILIRNGFGFILLEQMGFANRTSMAADLPQLGRRIRNTLCELGPTFIKIGQFASTRSDILPEPIVHELESLQDKVPPLAFSEVQQAIEQELGSPIPELFAEFDPFPLASASIGQVHRAVLPGGETVAVKIQRPHIQKVIHTDLEIIKDIIAVVEQRFPAVVGYALPEILDEFSQWLKRELDYIGEGKNAEKIAGNFKDDPHIVIPRIFWDFSTTRVLTMTYIDGIKLNDRSRLASLPCDKSLIARRLNKAMLQQIIRDGLFHGDPHPGNIFVLPDGKIAFVDFGIVGRLTPALKRRCLDMMISAKGDLEKIWEKHLNVPLKQVALPELGKDLFNMVSRHHIDLPADLILLGKSLLILEGVIRELDPNISVAELAKPLRGQFIKEPFLIFKWIAKVRAFV